MRVGFVGKCCVGVALSVAGCDGDTQAPATSTSDGTASGGDGDGDGVWFDAGWGVDAFTPLEDGDDLTVVLGGQGLEMFPIPIRGAGFGLPDDPSDYTDERAPLVNLHVDIEGHNDGVGGHYRRMANYAIPFTVLPDGTYEFLYIAVILPDGPDDPPSSELVGLPAHLHVEIRPHDHAPIAVDKDLVIALESP